MTHLDRRPSLPVRPLHLLGNTRVDCTAGGLYPLDIFAYCTGVGVVRVDTLQQGGFERLRSHLCECRSGRHISRPGGEVRCGQSVRGCADRHSRQERDP